jgi:hypothetical protein
MLKSTSCSSNYDWTVPVVWMGTLSSWETASLFGNIVWIMGCTRLVNLSTYSLAVIWLWRVITGPAEYCTTILLPKPSQHLHRVSLLKPGFPDCGLPGGGGVSKRKLFLKYGTMWWTTHLTISRSRFQLSDVQTLRSWHRCLHYFQ